MSSLSTTVACIPQALLRRGVPQQDATLSVADAWLGPPTALQNDVGNDEPSWCAGYIVDGIRTPSSMLWVWMSPVRGPMVVRRERAAPWKCKQTYFTEQAS